MRGIAFVPEVARFGPFTALPTATADISAEDAGLGDDIELLAPGLAALAMLAWIGAVFATRGGTAAKPGPRVGRRAPSSSARGVDGGADCSGWAG
jgi:hypothetical protein